MAALLRRRRHVLCIERNSQASDLVFQVSQLLLALLHQSFRLLLKGSAPRQQRAA